MTTLAAAAVFGVAGFFSIVLGSCHGGGGFCATELDLDAILEGYVAVVVLVGWRPDWSLWRFLRRGGVLATICARALIGASVYVIWLETA